MKDTTQSDNLLTCSIVLSPGTSPAAIVSSAVGSQMTARRVLKIGNKWVCWREEV